MIEDLETINKWLKEEYGISYTELKKEFNSAVELSNKRAKKIIQKDKEIERLNDNWNELRKWVVNNKYNENTEERYLVVDYGTLLDKMSELKGVDKE